MSEPSAPERGYRRLLAWYPRSFRREQEDEMLAVLMAGAGPEQRHPGLLDAADLITSPWGFRTPPGVGLTGALLPYQTIGPAAIILLLPGPAGVGRSWARAADALPATFMGRQ